MQHKGPRDGGLREGGLQRCRQRGGAGEGERWDLGGRRGRGGGERGRPCYGGLRCGGALGRLRQGAEQ